MEWSGVECNNNNNRRVIGLDLSNTRGEDMVDWYLNASLFHPFKGLKTLDLSHNSIAGFAENEGLGKLSATPSHLESLDLSGNNLNDSILLSLSHLSSLRYVYLGSNQFKGGSYLKELKHLDLSWSRIESFSNKDETQWKLTKLEELDLSGNLFRNNTFSFPKGLSSLKSLNMRNNDLQGSLDLKELSNPRNLKKLDLSQNQIENLEPIQDAGNKLKLFTHLDANLFNSSVFASLNGLSNLKSLSLSDNLLKDMKDLDVFTHLRKLDLSGNELKDFVIHKGWCDLKKIQVLDVSRNAVEGMLPDCLGNLTSLVELDMSHNQLKGNLSSLANLTSLTYISLTRNHFQIPMSLEPLTNLKVLSIDQNKMVMEPSSSHISLPKFQLKLISMRKLITSQGLGLQLPTFLHYQYDLRYVDLSGNNFSGTFPVWLLKNNTKLGDLILMGNSFTGPLSLPSAPSSDLSVMDICDNKLHGQISFNICSTLSHLNSLYLYKNGFEGNIPTCLSAMKGLEILDLSNNQLSGRVLEGLMKSSLSILRLSNNNLSGNVFPAILNADGLSNLYLDGNSFSGEIAKIDVSAFGFPTSLNEIDLSNNKFYGKLPRWIGNLSDLESLALSNNSFDGSIPMEFCSLNSLEFLDLSQNNLSGSIPSCFNPPNIKHVHLHGNRLNGPLSRAFYSSTSLVTLDLGGNNLTGSIPEWIHTLSSLSVLLLKDNHLQGRISVELCKLYSLSIIDLSQNMFSGSIPSCLGNLTLPTQEKKIIEYGKYISYSIEDDSNIFGSETLDYNIIHGYPDGYIEEWVDFTTKNGSHSYGGNILKYMTGIDLSCNKLTGFIPPEFGNLSQIYSLNLSHNNLVGVIPSSFSKLHQIESLDLSHNNLSGEIPNQLVELNTLEVFSVAYNNLSGNIPEPKAQFGTLPKVVMRGTLFSVDHC